MFAKAYLQMQCIAVTQFGCRNEMQLHFLYFPSCFKQNVKQEDF